MKTIPRWRLLALLLLSSLCLPARSAPARRVVLALVPAVSAADLDPKAMPNFRRLLEGAAVGLMNTRTAALSRDPDDPETTADPARANAYLTLGAGTRCAVGPPGGEGFTPDETLWEGPAAQVYARRNLLPLDSPGVRGIQIDLELIRETNSGLGYRADPGAMGDLLRRHGLKTAVLGDADRPAEVHREGLLTAMDAEGRVDYAYLQTSAPRPDAAFGRAISLPALDRALKSALAQSQFVVMDWGDTARLDDQSLMMLPRADAVATPAALRRLDGLFGLLLKHLDFRRDRLLIVSPYPSRMARSAFDTLCPVILVGDGVRPGLLTSPTTRRTGVVANVDVAPTVAAAFDITGLPASVVGRPMASAPAPAAWGRLLAMRARQLEVERERRSVLRDIVSLLTWGMLLLALLFFSAKGRAAQWMPLTLAFVAPAIPLALLILAYVQFPSADAFALALWLLVLLLAGGASAVTRLRCRAVDGIAFLVSGTAALVVADGLAGFPHMPTCILSYSLMEGARYYGIGNEYMGSFLAVTCLAGTALFTGRERKLAAFPRLAVAGLFLLGTLVLAGPAFGAKFGGGVAAAGGFGVCLLLLSLRKFKARYLWGILFGIAAVVALMVLLDSLRGGHSSHIGRAFAAVQSGGWGELGLIVQRKSGMNLRLLMFSPWSRLMGAGLLATVAACLSRRSRRLPALPHGPLGAGIAGAVAAALVAFLVDDAGVLAAATALIFVPPALLAADRDEPLSG